MNVTALNKFVVTFLDENEGAEDLVGLWKDNENQKEVRKLCKSSDSGGKRKKDPSHPKRPKSSYMFFCEENRPLVKNDLGDDAKTTDITRELGKRWNSLKARLEKGEKNAKAEMAKHEKSHEDDKARYEKEMESYTPPDDFESPQKGRRGKKRKDGPKNAKSAYMFFCDSNRAAVKKYLGEDVKVTEITRELGKRWNDLKSDENRADELEGYKKQAAEDKARYESEKVNTASAAKTPTKKAPEKKEPVKGKKAVAKSSSKKTSKSTEKKGKNGKKATVKSSDKKLSDKKQTGYHVFCADHREEVKDGNPKWTPRQVTSELSKRWKALSAEEQKAYKNRAVGTKA